MIAQSIFSKDGTLVPHTSSVADEVKAIIIILPAMGVRASFYSKFQDALCACGHAAYTMEYRGLGMSELRAGWTTDFGYKEYQEDVAATIAMARQTFPDRPLYIAGHSLGGHFAMLTAGLEPESFDGIIMLASGTPWHGAFEGKAGKRLKMFGRYIPVFMNLIGYYPGHRLGFAGREFRSMMRDWLQLARHNRFKIKGVSDAIELSIAEYKGRVLCLSFERDTFAPLKASKLMLSKMPEADCELRILTDDDIEGEATHFGWAKRPHVVSRLISDWML